MDMGPGMGRRRAYLLTMDHPIVLDTVHAEAILPYIDHVVTEDGDD